MAVFSGLLKLGALLGFVAALASSEAPAQTVRVKVASTAKEVFDNLPLFIARDKGIFKANGLDVEVAHFSGGGEVVRAVSSRSMQFGMAAATVQRQADRIGNHLRRPGGDRDRERASVRRGRGAHPRGAGIA